MSHTRLWIAAAILACVIFISFLFSVPHTRDIVETPALQREAGGIPSVSLHDSFKKGLHTITGSVEVPDACTSVTAQATPVGTASSTESILVALTIPEDLDICLERATAVKFSTTISAPAQLPIVVTVNGVTATTTTL